MDSVVFVHGLWMVGIDMSLLKKRVRACGFKVYQFSYPSVRNSPLQNAKKLQQFLATIDSKKIHFVAHSLGGLVVRHLFSLYPDQASGNIVTLGTPHQGSYIAKELSKHRWGRTILGKSVQQGLLGDVPAWQAKNKLGVIAGSSGMGVGRIIAKFNEPNDGSVLVAETRLSGMTQHLVLDCGHTGYLYNRNVAQQVCNFLKFGSFC